MTRSASRTICGLIGAVGLLMTVMPRAMANTLTIKDEAFVKGPKVLLGDVARITGERAEPLASVVVAPAATPGASKNIDAAYLMSRIQSAGFSTDDVHLTGARSVKATTLHLEVTKEMVAEDLRRFIELEMPWDPAQTTVDVAAPAQDIVVPDGELTFTWRSNPEYRYLGPGAFRGEVAVDGQLQKVVTCRVTVEAYGSVVVAATDIPRGKLIGPNDLTSQKRSLSAVGEGAFQNPGEAAGYVARTMLFAGQVVTKRHIAPRKLISRNQMVAVEMRAGALEVRTVAQAVSDGYDGDVVTCQNPVSKELFQGLVRKDGVVVVE